MISHTTRNLYPVNIFFKVLWHHNWYHINNCRIKGDVFPQKCKKVVKANADLPDLRKIASFLGWDPEEHLIKMSPQQIISFKFTPITSTEMERKFLFYKNILNY